MIINKDSWHARVYRWWYQSKYGKKTYDWFSDKWTPNEPERSNLCPYMRAVMFWSWMRWLFIGGKIKKFPVPVLSWLFLLIEVPRWLGIISYTMKLTILMFYVAFVGAAAVVFLASVVVWLWKDTDKLDWLRKVCRGVSEFGSLVGQYTQAKHDRICPEITFAEGE